MSPPHDKPAKSTGNRHEPAKDFGTRTFSIDAMETSTVKETTMTRFHTDAQSAQPFVYPIDPFVASDRAHEARSQYLSHLAGVLRANLARAMGRTLGSHQAWQGR